MPFRWIATLLLSASSSPPDASGTVSSSIRAIAGIVNLRVLSFGPPLPSSSVVPILGTLKPPGSSSFVATLPGLKARKKDARRATPAPMRTRLTVQEMMFLIRNPGLLPRDFT